MYRSPKYGPSSYTAGVPASAIPQHAPSATANGNAARFMSKQPLFPARFYDRQRHERPPYDGNLEKFKSGCWRKCTWKCAALAFIFLSILLVALVAFFLGKCIYVLKKRLYIFKLFVIFLKSTTVDEIVIK